MGSEDIRWEQRFNNFNKAFAQLENAVEQAKKNSLNELEQQGLIQRFEFTHELAWNVLKDYFTHQGNTFITGSRDATREAFNVGLIADGEGWMEMIKSRNLSSHTYNEDVAKSIVHNIIDQYFDLFKAFQKKMQTLTS